MLATYMSPYLTIQLESIMTITDFFYSIRKDIKKSIRFKLYFAKYKIVFITNTLTQLS